VVAAVARVVVQPAVLATLHLYPHHKEIMVEVLLTNVPLLVVVAQVQ
jgi:hypothetical protein